jgi:hypothetical protein
MKAKIFSCMRLGVLATFVTLLSGTAGAETILAARVGAGGNLLAAQGVFGAGRVRAGEYAVYFNRSVAACVPVVSGGPWRAFVFSVAEPPTEENSVKVWMDGSRDGEFHLIVYCP